MVFIDISVSICLLLSVQMRTSASCTASPKTTTSSSPCPARSKTAPPALRTKEMSALMECVRYMDSQHCAVKRIANKTISDFMHSQVNVRIKWHSAVLDGSGVAPPALKGRQMLEKFKLCLSNVYEFLPTWSKNQDYSGPIRCDHFQFHCKIRDLDDLV